MLPIRLDPSFSLSLSAQLADQVMWLIAAGHLSADDELPAARDLAAQLDVNFHTVRAAYRRLADAGYISISRGRRCRVLPAEARTGAGGSPPRRTSTIGVVIPSFSSFYAPFLDGLEAATAALPAMTMICNAHQSTARAAGFVERLAARGADGIVVASLDLRPEIGPPIVLVDAGRSPSSIDFDLERSQYLATNHLVAHGHRRIGFVTPPTVVHNLRPKYVGHARALREAGLDDDPSLIVETDGFDTRAGEAAARQLMTLAHPPTAIASATDTLAIGVFHALASRSIRVPDDVALMGNDDIEMASVIRPALSSVRLPAREAGRLAVERLQRLLDGHPAEEPLTLDVTLVERESCGCRT